MQVKDIYTYLDSIAPFDCAEAWDNVGLLIGSPSSSVSKILLSLDITDFVIDEAIENGVDLIITHHPVIFSPLKSVDENSFVYKLIKNGISVISSHTCLDIAENGVNDCLAKAVGLKNVIKTEDAFLKIGEIPEISEKEFANLLKEKLNTVVSYNKLGKNIKKVAFCSGAGGEYYALSKDLGADALLTGEAKYHEFIDAENAGITIFSAGHFETEIVVLDVLLKQLKEKFKNIEIIKSNQKNNIITI